MANSNKKKKNSTIDWASVIMKSIIVAIVVIVALFFIYMSGLLPKCVEGIKITKKDANGKVVTIDSLPVVEVNYYYSQLLTTYRMYGYLDGIDLDSPVNSASSTATYREMFYNNAAASVLSTAMIDDIAEQNGFLEMSGIDRYTDIAVEGVRTTASDYGFTSVEGYLSQMYGTGFSVNSLRNCVRRDSLSQEYQNYLGQFELVPTQEDIDNEISNNVTLYNTVDYNYYYFPATVNSPDVSDSLELAQAEEGANVDEELYAEVLEEANYIADNATDPETFRELVMDALEGDDAALEAFADDADPTSIVGYSYDEITQYHGEDSEELDFLFSDGEAGDTIVIEATAGVYVYLLNDRYQGETPNVAYRTLTLSNEAALEEDATAEETQAGMDALRAEAQGLVANVTDAAGFCAVVKDNSDVASQILTGGYLSNQIYPTNTDTFTDSDFALNDWLFSADRVAGDVYYLPSSDNTTLTVYYFEESAPAYIALARSTLITASLTAWSDANLTAASPEYQINMWALQNLSY